MQEPAFLIVILLCALALSAIALAYYLKKLHLDTQLLGIQWLQALRFLLMHLQKHRGLTTSWLSGHPEVQEELDELKQQISSNIKSITQIGEWINQNQDWQGVTQHWARLSGARDELAFAKCFSQHTKLIASVLAMMDVVADKHNISSTGKYSNEVSLWHEFLWVGELLGQCRALGVRILGLRSHNEELQKHKKHVVKALRDIEDITEKTRFSNRLSREEMDSLQHFIEFIRHHLTESAGLISAIEYFNQASEAISLIYDCFDREMFSLHGKISANPQVSPS